MVDGLDVDGLIVRLQHSSVTPAQDTSLPPADTLWSDDEDTGKLSCIDATPLDSDSLVASPHTHAADTLAAVAPTATEAAAADVARSLGVSARKDGVKLGAGVTEVSMPLVSSENRQDGFPGRGRRPAHAQGRRAAAFKGGKSVSASSDDEDGSAQDTIRAWREQRHLMKLV